MRPANHLRCHFQTRAELHTKQASCLWQWQLLSLSSPTSDRGHWGARKSTGQPTVAKWWMGQAPLSVTLQSGSLPLTSQSSRALSSYIPAHLKQGTWWLEAVPGLVKGHSLKPLSLQQLPQHSQLLAFLGPAGNLFLVWVESDCLGFFSIFPLSGKIIWMKENRAKITFPHSWAAPPLH